MHVRVPVKLPVVPGVKEPAPLLHVIGAACIEVNVTGVVRRQAQAAVLVLDLQGVVRRRSRPAP